MRTRYGTILVAVATATIGIAWFAMRERDTATAPVDETPVKKKVSKAVPTKARRTGDAPAAKPKPTLPAVEKRETEKRETEKREPEMQATKVEEKPAQEEQAAPEREEQAAQEKTNDNPFPRYLDMFKNNPEALAAEFQKEAEKEHAALAKVREHAIEELKLNAEQVAVFEKALDDLRDQVTRINGEWAELIASGQLNDDDDGSILTSNRLLGQRFVAAREKAMRETSEKLYDQLVLDGVSDAKKQAWLFIAAHRTATSIECLEPNLAVYDKLYKNYGMGEGLFSWCSRQRQQQGKK